MVRIECYDKTNKTTKQHMQEEKYMWTRAQLKDKAKVTFKRNYWKTVLISFLLAVIVGSGAGNSGINFKFNDNNAPGMEWEKLGHMEDGEIQVSDEVEEFLAEIDNAKKLIENETNTAKLAGIVVGIVVTALVVAAVAIAIAILINAFLINPLVVGIRKFFVSNLNTEAQAKELGFGFDHNYKNTVKTMFFRDLYTFLWSLLFIIPGIVKAYEYRMIPYLITENPELTKEEAFALSRQMMNGQKWNAFVLDLSFIGWRILGAMTFGILNVFYVDPYKNMTDAALFEALKPQDSSYTEQTQYIPQ